jgi:hypothetical protein
MPTSAPTAPAPSSLTPEVIARMDEALRARPLEDLPSSYARRIYEVLVAHGFDRADLLSVAASLVDLVTEEVTAPPRMGA